MADNDRIDKRETYGSPFQTLSKQVANLRIQEDKDSTQEVVEDEPKVVESIESLCMSCQENVQSIVFGVYPVLIYRFREKRVCF